MGKIKCFENYKRLKLMFERNDTGSLEYFAKRLGVSKRTVSRMINYLGDINNFSIEYDKCQDRYYLKLR